MWKKPYFCQRSSFVRKPRYHHIEKISNRSITYRRRYFKEAKSNMKRCSFIDEGRFRCLVSDITILKEERHFSFSIGWSELTQKEFLRLCKTLLSMNFLCHNRSLAKTKKNSWKVCLHCEIFHLFHYPYVMLMMNRKIYKVKMPSTNAEYLPKMEQ